MAERVCLICNRDFYTRHGGQRYCGECRKFSDSGMTAVYGLYKDGGSEIRYIGSTYKPVQRFTVHRSGKGKGNEKLAAWVNRIGGDNLRMIILEAVPHENARKSEETQIRHYEQAGHRLFNTRQAVRRLYSGSEAQSILSKWLDGRKPDF